MVMPGETILTGASDECPDCEKKLKFEVMRSPAGFYVGTQCCCGPYSRESGYYAIRKKAEEDLKNNNFGR